MENYKTIKTQLLLKRKEYLLEKNKRVRNENRMYNKFNTRSLENSPSKYYHEQKILKAYKQSFVDRLSYIEEKKRFKQNRELYIYQKRKKSKKPRLVSAAIADFTDQRSIDRIYRP